MNGIDYLDWASYGLDTKNDTYKVEHILLASFVDPNHSAIIGLKFESDIYQALAHIWLPNLYEIPELITLNEHNPFFETPFVLGELENHQTPPYGDFRGYDGEALIYGHMIMFDTNFGRKPVQDLYLKNSFVSEKIVEELSTETDPNWVAEHLIALICLDKEVPQDRVEEVRSWRNSADLGWENYHPHLVTHLFDAIEEHKAKIS